IVPHTQDGDSLPDYRDLDTDNDGKADALEGYDKDGNGIAEITASGQDSDGDGLDDAFDKDNNSLADTNGASNGDTPNSFPPSSTVASERAWRAFGGGSFPVEWLDFAVVWEDLDASLSWSTASENASDFFEVQRSLDGLTFQPIGEVKAAGSSVETRQYQFKDIDAASLKLNKYYYRIRQVDLDGAYDYSNVIELNRTLSEGEIALSAYPNPTQDIVEIRYAAFRAGTLDLRVFNSLGQVVHQQRLTYDKGNQFQTLDLSGWKAGLYILELTSEQYASSLKLIKQ
ncbi:MAG: T9SS type A sorting domain-containing protein, partial [Bacteroidota bacterium]